MSEAEKLYRQLLQTLSDYDLTDRVLYLSLIHQCDCAWAALTPEEQEHFGGNYEEP